MSKRYLALLLVPAFVFGLSACQKADEQAAAPVEQSSEAVEQAAPQPVETQPAEQAQQPLETQPAAEQPVESQQALEQDAQPVEGEQAPEQAQQPSSQAPGQQS